MVSLTTILLNGSHKSEKFKFRGNVHFLVMKFKGQKRTMSKNNLLWFFNKRCGLVNILLNIFH